MRESEVTGKKLEQMAAEAAKSAYAPYSNFRVGAAVRTANETFVGANVENASFGLSICAERVALAKAITSSEKEILEIAIACIDARDGSPISERMPCGACRQWIAELAPAAIITIVGSDQKFRLNDLLPNAFVLRERPPRN